VDTASPNAARKLQAASEWNTIVGHYKNPLAFTATRCSFVGRLGQTPDLWRFTETRCNLADRFRRFHTRSERPPCEAGREWIRTRTSIGQERNPQARSYRKPGRAAERSPNRESVSWDTLLSPVHLKSAGSRKARLARPALPATLIISSSVPGRMKRNVRAPARRFR
jgi:hypothetical protein